MKETAIIYCRKSTDRDDLQQNSIEHQLTNCRNTVEKCGFLVLDEISEKCECKNRI